MFRGFSLRPISRRVVVLRNKKSGKNGPLFPLAQQISLKSDRLLAESSSALPTLAASSMPSLSLALLQSPSMEPCFCLVQPFAMQIQFRPATLQDAPVIAALIQTLAQGFMSNPDGSGAEKFWLSVSEPAEASYIADPRYSYTLAISTSELAGFIAMRDISHVFHLFVGPKFQHQGLATQLWEQALFKAKDSGHESSFTVNASLAATAFYRRLGFTATGGVIQANGVSFLPMLRA